MMAFVFGAGVLLLLIYAVLALIHDASMRNEGAHKSVQEASAEFVRLLDHTFSVSPDRMYVSRWTLEGIAFDGHERVAFAKLGEPDPRVGVFTQDQLFASEIVVNGTSVSRHESGAALSRGLAGGLLFGVAGAVVGGLSGSVTHVREVASVTLKVLVDDTSFPERRVTFLATRGGPVASESAEAVLDLEGRPEPWHQILTVLMERAKRKAQS